MKLSLNWLKDYIDPKLSTDELAERLTMAGLEVEAVEARGRDMVLEMEITPNRPDCLSVLGLGREISAITGRALKCPKIREHKTVTLKDLVRIENKKDCCRYIATLMRDARIKDAPTEMKARLEAMGINVINNAVDITNFVLMETGQPLHVFDYDKLSGGKIIVRRARAGESIITLDGVERKLDPEILVVADAEKPVAIAGIMGGQDAQITAQTKNILLESAHFEMGIVRRACRRLGLRSESSYRFERNVDLDGVLTGAGRAVDLLLQTTGGHLGGRAEIFSKTRISRPKIKVRISGVKELLGIEVAPAKVKGWLVQLGFKAAIKAGILTVVPPSNRADVAQEADVIEEVARMVGFDRLPAQIPVIKSANITVDARPREIKTDIRRALTAAGMDEIITLSMINAATLVKTNITQMPGIKIFNPLSQDQELMRPVLLPSFLQVAATNMNRGQKNLRFFEIGKTYFQGKERDALGVFLTGRRTHDWRASEKEQVDIFDLKGALERVFQITGTGAGYEDVAIPAFDPGCAAYIAVNGKQIGIMGRVNRSVLNNWDIKHQDIYFAALFLDEILSASHKAVRYEPISEFPAIVRDVSLAVDKSVPYKKIEDICRQQGGEILKSVQFIEQYSGDKIQPGCKGIVFSCRYQSSSRTLREDEVTQAHERLVQALSRDLNAVRR
ncbi:MAG: phenylalanine--tRNA ligase subunit beta [Candidatus Omnitrophica bacterium]|nr:phenylalanine--tRNA ligase subunit beta [Candidatus Omnitrophota bacterium]